MVENTSDSSKIICWDSMSILTLTKNKSLNIVSKHVVIHYYIVPFDISSLTSLYLHKATMLNVFLLSLGILSNQRNNEKFS